MQQLLTGTEPWPCVHVAPPAPPARSTPGTLASCSPSSPGAPLCRAPTCSLLLWRVSRPLPSETAQHTGRRVWFRALELLTGPVRVCSWPHSQVVSAQSPCPGSVTRTQGGSRTCSCREGDPGHLRLSEGDPQGPTWPRVSRGAGPCAARGPFGFPHAGGQRALRCGASAGLCAATGLRVSKRALLWNLVDF